MSLFGMAPRRSLRRHLWRVSRAFIAHRGNVHPLAYYLNMLEEQITEAREHVAAGNMDKACAELADTIVVAFEAIHAQGRDPERVTVARIRERILPNVPAIERAYRHNGRKKRANDSAASAPKTDRRKAA